jgi:hypothetical protein
MPPVAFCSRHALVVERARNRVEADPLGAHREYAAIGRQKFGSDFSTTPSALFALSASLNLVLERRLLL